MGKEMRWPQRERSVHVCDAPSCTPNERTVIVRYGVVHHVFMSAHHGWSARVQYVQ